MKAIRSSEDLKLASLALEIPLDSFDSESTQIIDGVLDQVLDLALVIFDPSGVVKVWSKGAESHFGLSSSELERRHFSELIPVSRSHMDSDWSQKLQQTFNDSVTNQNIRVLPSSGMAVFQFLRPLRAAVGQVLGYSLLLKANSTKN